MVSLDGVDPELRRRVENMLKLGRGCLRVSSALRSSSDQRRLYSLYLAGKGAPANKPGTSKHEQGLAVDVECVWMDNPVRSALVEQCGLIRPYEHEPWHMELHPDWQPPSKPQQGEDDMQPVTALCTRKSVPGKLPRWVLVPETRDLRALDGAEFYGNVFDLNEQDQPDSVYGIEELPDRDGYAVLGWKDGSPDWYGAFDAQLWAELSKQK